jgi:hypothetical protein
VFSGKVFFLVSLNPIPSKTNSGEVSPPKICPLPFPSRSCPVFSHDPNTRRYATCRVIYANRLHHAIRVFEKQTNKETNKQTKKQTNKQTNKETKKQTNRQTDRQTDGQTNKQTDTQPKKQTNKQTNNLLLAMRQHILFSEFHASTFYQGNFMSGFSTKSVGANFATVGVV